MAKVVKRSCAPLYLAAAVWPLCGLFLPFYRPVHYAAAALVSVAVYIIGKAVFPDRTFQTREPEAPPKAETPPKQEEPPKAETTGDPELDALIRERDLALSEMRRLNDAIEDPTVSAQIDHLEGTTAKIFSHVVEHPKKLPQIRRFMRYYLPTTLKLLNAYDRMGAAGVSGENIDGTMGKIESMMDTVVRAFDRQLDALFADEALDISTDITVMEGLLAQEGLTSSPFHPESGTQETERKMQDG